MNRSDIAKLKNLSETREHVPFDAIPNTFQDDFNRYFFGKTVIIDSSNRKFAYASDIRNWVHSLFIKYGN